jgi:cytochrome P450
LWVYFLRISKNIHKKNDYFSSIAGIESSEITFQPLILFIDNYPEMQNKMRKEIDSVIGDRMPVQEDRNHCHYVNAFISEGMRYRPVVPISFPHKNVVQSKIGTH